jgi:uncharacterized protein (TIGR03083 family)
VVATRSDLRRYALAERASIHGTLQELTPDQWRAGTLCHAWTVHDLAAHLAAAIHDGPARFLAGLTRARFDHDRYNLARSAVWARRTSSELLAALDSDHLPLLLRAVPSLIVVDYVVHHQDIRRPLGLPGEPPAAHLRAALDAVATARPFAADAARFAGKRLVATDLDWAHGSGPEVRGPAEALLMTLMGRDVGLTAPHPAG